jgi:DNA-binding transcriptional LysR family regulator
MNDIDLKNIRRLDGGLLLIFRGLLRRGQTTAVAEELGLSQSAVSHALTRLRDLFDDPLFIRRPRGLEPTRRALELAPRVDALIDLAGETLEREGKFDPARSTRRFMLGAPEFVTALIGAELVKAFRRHAPSASFVVVSDAREPTFDAIRRGELDLALGRFGAPPAGITSRLLFEDRYCVVARRGHPKVRGKISYEDWLAMGHVFAASSAEEPQNEEKAKLDIAFVAVVPRWLTALVMVSQSDAIATCPMKLAKRQARVLGLQVIAAPYLQDQISVFATRRSSGSDPGIDWFAQQVRNAIG